MKSMKLDALSNNTSIDLVDPMGAAKPIRRIGF